MLSRDKQRQIYCFNKEQLLYSGFSTFTEMENQKVSLPRAADKNLRAQVQSNTTKLSGKACLSQGCEVLKKRLLQLYKMH